MAAFDRILSGIPEMDKALDNIRLGDNVVWRVSELSEFRLFMEPYVRQAVKDKRKIIYFRFAAHEPFITDIPEVKTIEIPLSHRFENFTVEIHNAIEREGRDAFYVFDCLSELQTAWATDLMMGNFFRVTCPFLFVLDTVAFFPLIRGKHSVHSVNKIIDTTQLFLDVYTGEKDIFVRPEKVWNRNSDTMFLPHIFEPNSGKFRPVTDGVRSSRFYNILGKLRRGTDDRNTDSWDRFFNNAKIRHSTGADISDECEYICNIMMTRDSKMRQMVKKNFTPEDYFEVRSHMIGTGMIGGKACGMLLSRAIIRNREPDINNTLEPHDSFYIGSDVYYTYIVDNGFWDMRIKQRTEEGYFKLADQFRDLLQSGKFSDVMREQFGNIIEYYGQDPYIVRSSSILEDGFGNAFAGKYESVFCANRGSYEDRLAEFENAIKTVYASTMGLSALDYRKRRGLDKRDEQMALLVQRVSGSYYGSYYMPCAAGVGYSYSPYRFLQTADPGTGMLRLVMGLGTSAVDRTEGSYPRLVSLDMPERTPYSTAADKHKFSQRNAEVINTSKHDLERVSLDTMLPVIPRYLGNILLEHDFEAEQRLREMGRDRDIRFISCQGLVKNKKLMESMRRMLACIQSEYDYPVDTEFTINVSDDGEYTIDLLQCRPLQVIKGNNTVTMPENITDEHILLHTKGASMGLSRTEQLDYIVYVDPIGYYNMPYNDKSAVARLIGKINWHFRGSEEHLMLMVPGRIGTSSKELGVPTMFSDISGFDVICEMEESRAGYNPELSYGSHIFQDLVEAEILYTAVFDNSKTLAFYPEKLNNFENISDMFDESGELTDIVKVFRVQDCMLYHDINKEQLIITL